MLLRLLFAALFAVTAVCAIPPQPASTNSSLKIHMLAGAPVVDGIYLDGHGPYRFVVDTGAQRSRISAALAASLNWVPAFETRVITQSHAVMRDGYRVRNVRLGPVETSDEEFVAASFAAIQELDPQIQGFLGQSFLSKVDYLIDFRRRQLRFGSTAVRGGVKTAFELSHGCMVTPTSQGQLTLDSGAATVVLYDPSDGKWKGRLSVHSTEGRSTVRYGELRKLRVAGREFRNVDAAASARRKFDETDSDGLLPASLFDSLYVSNSGGYVVFNPEQ